MFVVVLKGRYSLTESALSVVTLMCLSINLCTLITAVREVKSWLATRYLCSQGCVVLEDSENISLHAPKGSASMKSSEKGVGQQVYRFSFTQVNELGLSFSAFIFKKNVMFIRGLQHSRTFVVLEQWIDNFFFLIYSMSFVVEV